MGLNVKNKIAMESKFITTGLSGDAVNATANGASFDRDTVQKLPEGPFEDGFLLVQLEAITGSPSAISVTLRIEDSADDSTFAAVTDLAKVEAATVNFTAVGIKTVAFRLTGLRRYVRAAVSAITLTGGSSPSVKVRALFVLTSGRQA
jgi:hypothetical protein